MTRSKRLTLTTGSLLALAVLFIALTILANRWLAGWRLDLTEDRLYTLSPGSERILTDLKEPVNLYFFFSDSAVREVPVIRTYANRVRELLQEYVSRSGGQLKLHLLDPQPFSEEEDRAARFGLQAVPVGGEGTLYFGLAGTNTVDGVEVIPFFQPDKEALLEYDLSKLIYSLAHPKKPVIGVISTLPIVGGFDSATGRMQQPWVMYEQLRQLFDIRSLGPDVKAIEPDVDVLMLIHPKGLPEAAHYAIDQFVLRGGRLLAFVDPDAQFDPAARGPGGMPAVSSSNLPRLFAAWGLEMDAKTIIADSGLALAVNVRPGAAPVRHLGILNLTDKTGLGGDDPVTAGLDAVNLALAGALKAKEGATTTLVPLLRSTDLAMPIAVERLAFLPDPAELQKGFKPTGERYLLAARVQGKVKSAFSDGPPKEAKAAADPSKPADGKDPPAPSTHRAESDGPIQVIVVADSDLLNDRLWVQVQDFFGQRVATAWANNGDFVANALDNLTGNSDLISIRGRAVSARPFTTVQDLERRAGDRLQAKAQELEAELQETERTLNELQRARSDRNAALLTPEQQAELKRFQQRKLDIRKELRQVRRDLDKDIEHLGTVLKIINILMIPLLLSALAVAAVWLQGQRRKRGEKPA